MLTRLSCLLALALIGLPAFAIELRSVAPHAIQSNYASASTTSGDSFGYATDISGRLAVIGSPSREHDGVRGSGAAYVFNAAVGSQVSELLPTDLRTDARFGRSVAIDKEVAIVGAPQDDELGYRAGAAYLFDARTGSEQKKLLPDSLDASNRGFFGSAVAIGDGIAAVSSNSGVYIYDSETGNQIHKVITTDAQPTTIAIDGEVLVVSDAHSGSGRGSAFVYNLSTGSKMFDLIPSDKPQNGTFGTSVAIGDGVIVVGARGSGPNLNSPQPGAAFIFDLTTGDQLAKLVPSDGEGYDYFGNSVTVDSGIVSIGAFSENSLAENSGALYLFDALSGEELFKIKAEDAGSGDSFGWSVAMDEGLIVTGANHHGERGRFAGAAYTFSAVPEPSTCLILTCLLVMGTLNTRGRLALVQSNR